MYLPAIFPAVHLHTLASVEFLLSLVYSVFVLYFLVPAPLFMPFFPLWNTLAFPFLSIFKAHLKFHLLWHVSLFLWLTLSVLLSLLSSWRFIASGYPLTLGDLPFWDWFLSLLLLCEFVFSGNHIVGSLKAGIFIFCLFVFFTIYTWHKVSQ